MKDPLEGLDENGLITTGVGRDRVPSVYEPVLAAAVARVASLAGTSSGLDDHVELHLYGSVATGMAKPGDSDVDLFTIGLEGGKAAALAVDLSALFASLGRGVEIGAAQWDDYSGDSDAAYGNRIFLRHYALRLLGSHDVALEAAFRGDARAARGLNGDIGVCLARWRQVASDPSPSFSRRVARKTLLAIASLVSVHDATWTTDRESGAARWVEMHSEWADACAELLRWSAGGPAPAKSLERALSEDGVVGAVVDDFRRNIGLWKATT